MDMRLLVSLGINFGNKRLRIWGTTKLAKFDCIEQERHPIMLGDIIFFR